MRRRNPVPIFILVLAVIGIAGAYLVFQSAIAPRFARNHQVLESASDVRLGLTLDYLTGPIAQERWTMRDVNGTSTSSYRALGRNGIAVTIDERARESLDAATNVAFLFGKVVQDGIWDVPSRPPRGNTNIKYTIDVFQLIDNQHGGRSFTFTDPHYWATTGGHQFEIHLAKGKPLPNLLQMSSTTLVEPRYDTLVHDFLDFGPATFRARIAAEKKRRYGVAS